MRRRWLENTITTGKLNGDRARDGPREKENHRQSYGMATHTESLTGLMENIKNQYLWRRVTANT